MKMREDLHPIKLDSTAVKLVGYDAEALPDIKLAWCWHDIDAIMMPRAAEGGGEASSSTRIDVCKYDLQLID